MKLHVVAVGRLRAGPERALIQDYLQRFNRTGRAFGLGPVLVHEVEDKRGGGRTAEAALLERAVPDGALICTQDERGHTLSSPEFEIGRASCRERVSVLV